MGEIETEPRVQVQTHPNPNYREYHTRMELTDQQIETLERGQLTEVNEILRIVLKIPGVIKGFLSPYRLAVTKAPMFTWEEIEPRVLEILRDLQRMPSAE